MAEHIIGTLKHIFTASEVLLQFYSYIIASLAVGIVLLYEKLRAGKTELVYALLYITNHVYIVILTGQSRLGHRIKNNLLQLVGILILVYQYLFKSVRKLVGSLRVYKLSIFFLYKY